MRIEFGLPGKERFDDLDGSYFSLAHKTYKLDRAEGANIFEC